MAKVLQFRRGTTSGISTVTGSEGELFVDLSKDTLVVMDGTTAGGQALQKEITASTNINAGIVTATTFSGALTGNVTGTATGLSGTPNITVGSITSGNINSSGIVTASSVTSPFFMNYNTILANFTVPANHNAISVGPITLDSGVVVTLGTNANWAIL